MKEILLSQGQKTKVDNEDYDFLMCRKWHAWWSPCTESYYAVGKQKVDGKWTSLYMARLIMGLNRDDKRQVDHVNHDTLDNRKENLRVVTHRQNHENRKNKSPYGTGVYKTDRSKPYKVEVRMGKERKHVGYFSTPEEARQARADFLQEVSP